MGDTEHYPNRWPQVMMAATAKHRANMSVKRLAKATEIPEQTLYKIARGEHQPRWAHAERLLEALPNSIISPLFDPLGMKVTAATGDRCDYTTLEALCRTAAEFSHALADGHVDHQEYGAMRHFVEGVRDLCDAWLAEPSQPAAKVAMIGRVK